MVRPLTLSNSFKSEALPETLIPAAANAEGKKLDQYIKPYRIQEISSKGVVTEVEYEILEEIFKNLATVPIYKLPLYLNSLEKLKAKVSHLHPFNTLETLKGNHTAKHYFFKIIHNKAWVWGKCKSAFKEELKDQHELENLLPHTLYFSAKMNLDSKVVLEQLSKEQYDKLIEYLMVQNVQ